MFLPPATIELRTPRALCAALLALAVSAGLAVGMSDAPAATFALVPALFMLAWPAPPRWRAMAFGSDGFVRLVAPDMTAEPLRLQRRGPLTVLTLRVDETVERVLFMTTGTLRADQRRLLSLWFERHAPRAQHAGLLTHV